MSGGFHFYKSPLHAAFLNPIHAGLAQPLLLRAEAGGTLALASQMGKAARLRIVVMPPPPQFSVEQRMYAAIRLTPGISVDEELDAPAQT